MKVYGWLLAGEEKQEVHLDVLDAGIWEESHPDTYKFTNRTFRTKNEARVALVFRLNELVRQAQELQFTVLTQVAGEYDDVWGGCGI